ncbi:MULTISPECIES: hypothetical protein [Ureibacillus]|jgi:hypothetical protein|uniref:Uncharacterized protein n=1 Tax=Ureibacillus thermosphaericus TaxID=51173 RepID=A0A840Q279_URETH|nr:hypothetical protein [Ureibacillus thermosphaericus]MBB5149146.1 hypothetical protein [Ureibacillus thermosphaericus]NKZ31909.1 hypothetical protein [Ureibacillus thermosphaericus]
MSLFHKRRKSYNPWLLPPWLRKIRFFAKSICIPITVFQAIRVVFIPTTGDVLLLFLLALISWLLWTDII